MILRDSRLTRHPNCLTNGVHLRVCRLRTGPVSGPALRGKDQTVALERTHSRLRHWLARFRRRTCVVSRSREMVDRSIALIAHLHINQEVEPSFCHLPLAQEVG